MRLKILLPHRTLVDRDTDKVIAESIHGSFCIEPRHVDYVAPLVAGILSYRDGDAERFVGVSDGVLVKVGDELLISVRDAVAGADLGRIREAVRERRSELRRHEEQAREVASRIETTLVRRFAELEEER